MFAMAGGLVVHILAAGALAAAAPNGLPDRYSATARRSAVLSCIACIVIVPLFIALRMVSGVRSFSASFDGVRPVGASWQLAQLFL